MKIIATSDTHGDLRGLDLTGADIALFAGDIAPLNGFSKWHMLDQVKWMRTKFRHFCESWPSTEIVFIPGNHDFFPLKDRLCSMLPGKDISLSLAPNAHMLIDSSIKIKGLNVYGTPWVPVISHMWAFEAYNDVLKTVYSKIPRGLDILLSHAPPRHGLVDVSLEYGYASDRFGSNELTEVILDKQPKMCFCGHIHSGDHKMTELGCTTVMNVSRVNESYEIAYEPAVIEI